MTSETEQLRLHTGPNCHPSPENIIAFQEADVVLLSGGVVGSGKSTITKELVRQGRVNIPSWTTRELRTGEVEGVDKCHASPGEMLEAVRQGKFLDLEKLGSRFYATPANLKKGPKYVKDVEFKGALSLRQYSPNVPIIVPLPPVDAAKGMSITEWERRVVEREGYHKRVPNDQAYVDLKERLQLVVADADIIDQHNLLNNPNVLFVVNDDLCVAMRSIYAFINHRERRNPSDLRGHIQNLRDIAATALAAAA